MKILSSGVSRLAQGGICVFSLYILVSLTFAFCHYGKRHTQTDLQHSKTRSYFTKVEKRGSFFYQTASKAVYSYNKSLHIKKKKILDFWLFFFCFRATAVDLLCTEMTPCGRNMESSAEAPLIVDRQTYRRYLSKCHLTLATSLHLT